MLIFFLALTALGQACSPFAPLTKNGAAISSLSLASECVVPTGVVTSIKTIEEAVALVNALPKPLSIACFLNSLERPLKVALTNNTVSAQPAVGQRSPRIFIINDKLFISVAPEGFGSHAVEFSLLTDLTNSIKAEIAFPVTETLSPSAPFDSILARGGANTLCSTCHTGEVRAPEVNYATAFKSVAFKPNPTTIVSLESLREQAEICDSKVELERCNILKGVFSRGEVVSETFPNALPVFF